MELKDIFHKWVPVYVRLPVLFILIFAILVANGVYIGNSNETANSLGVYPESFTEAYNAIYIGMSLGLIFHIRLKLRFTNKQLLLYGLVMQFIMNVVCANTANTTVFIGACFLIGFAKISSLIEVYVIWVVIWSKEFDASRFYPSFYFTALSGIYLTYWATTKVAYFYDWRHAYLIIYILLSVCIISALFLVENNVLRHRYPLYQLDWPGMICLATSMLLLNYAAINGRVEDWLNSPSITASLWASLFTFLLFLRRQLYRKRPLFDLKLFQKGTFRRGLLYCLLAGFFLPGNFQSAFSAGILNYDAPTNMTVNLYLIPGIFAGCILCFFWYYKKLDPDVLIIFGFLALVIYHVMMYFSFSKSYAEDDFYLPSFFKGFGTALLYIAMGLLTIKGLGLDKIISAAGAMLLCRSFLGSGIISAFYSYFLYTQRVRHVSYLAGNTDPGNYWVHAQGSSLYRAIQGEATLNAAKELTGLIVIGGCITLVILVLNYILKNWKRPTQPA